LKAKEKFGPIRRGLLEFVILKIISSQRVYAADILARLGDTEFATREGTLYPLLSRMRREELLEYEWVESDAGPPRKYYRLTKTGRQQLKELDGFWQQLNHTIMKIGTEQ
jgi:PadR family transcriptional regulator PadR